MADKDLFDPEDHMVRMTFGEHLEELRRRFILALLGFALVVPLGLALGKPLIAILASPVESELAKYDLDKKKETQKTYISALSKQKRQQNEETSPSDEGTQSGWWWFWRSPAKREELLSDKEKQLVSREELKVLVPRRALRDLFRLAVPELGIPEDPPETGTAGAEDNGSAPAGEDATAAADPMSDADLIGPVPMFVEHGALLLAGWSDLTRRLGMQSLSVQELFMAWMKVGLIAGLVFASPWVIYHLWMFVAEGLYRQERSVVYRAMPFSIGLFLVGVFFCWAIVLPVVVRFFFSFNKWLDIEPNIRVTEWLGFATILPVIFGACFELPLVMLVLENVGIFTIDDYISKWRHAILIISIVAMVATPTTDPGSMMLLMGPMVGLYFGGIGMVQMRRGGLRALSPVAKLRAVVGILVTLYLIAVSIGFVFPKSWVNHDWWLDQVWRPGTRPASWILRSFLESPSQNWMWGVTLLNAGVFGLVILRLGELVLRLVGRRSTSLMNESKPEKVNDDGGKQP